MRFPEQAEIILHGHYRLKGIEDPIEVFELAGHGAHAPRTPPPDVEKAYRVFQADGTWNPAKRNPPEPSRRTRPLLWGRTEELKSLWNSLERQRSPRDGVKGPWNWKDSPCAAIWLDTFSGAGPAASISATCPRHGPARASSLASHQRWGSDWQKTIPAAR